jgi:hypothetical protein
MMGYSSYTRSGTKGYTLNTDSLGQLGRQIRVIAAAAGAISETLAENQRGQARDFFERLGLPMPSLGRARNCKTPDCGCGSSCHGTLGTLRMVLDRPEEAEFTVKLHNSDCYKRSYSLLADKSGEGQADLVVTPATLTLDPCQSATVQVRANSGKLAYGDTLRGTIRIEAENCSPQFIELEVSVERPHEVIPTIELSCGCPTGMRRQHWSDHYYCDPPKSREVASRDVDETVRLALANREAIGAVKG